MSKSLIVFYSNTGTVERITNKLISIFPMDFEKLSVINETKVSCCKFMNAILRTCAFELCGKKVKLEPIKVNLDEYETIFIATPVHNMNISLPMRIFIEKNKDLLKTKKIVYFQCSAKEKLNKVVGIMEELIGIEIKVKMGITMKGGKSEEKEMFEKFVNDIEKEFSTFERNDFLKESDVQN